jgi:hypothetical protein
MREGVALRYHILAGWLLARILITRMLVRVVCWLFQVRLHSDDPYCTTVCSTRTLQVEEIALHGPTTRFSVGNYYRNILREVLPWEAEPTRLEA